MQLAAEVMKQYPLPEAMGTAKDIFKRLTVLSNEIPKSIRESYFLPVLPAIVKLCQTFPPLCSEATEFLVHLCKTSAFIDSQAPQLSPFSAGITKFHKLQSLEGTLYSDVESGSLVDSIHKAFQEVVSTTVVKT